MQSELKVPSCTDAATAGHRPYTPACRSACQPGDESYLSIPRSCALTPAAPWQEVERQKAAIDDLIRERDRLRAELDEARTAESPRSPPPPTARRRSLDQALTDADTVGDSLEAKLRASELFRQKLKVIIKEVDGVAAVSDDEHAREEEEELHDASDHLGELAVWILLSCTQALMGVSGPQQSPWSLASDS
jgi:hypothetical protein